jgi:hypothetical protein
MTTAPTLFAIASSAGDSFSLGFKIGVFIGVPIAAYVGYKLAKKLDLF